MGARSESLTGLAGNNLSSDELQNYPWNIFSKTDLETTVTNGQDVNFTPIAPINDSGPFEFYIPRYFTYLYFTFLRLILYLITYCSYGNEYTDLTRSRLTGWIQVKKIGSNGVETDADGNDDYSIINNIGLIVYRF